MKLEAMEIRASSRASNIPESDYIPGILDFLLIIAGLSYLTGIYK
jgi:hypothetical protein